MSKFYEFEVVFEDKEDSTLRELGLPDNNKGHLDSAMIDIEEIQSYYPCLKPGDSEKIWTKLNMKTTGEYFTIAIEYPVFKEFHIKALLK
jgi:hypothetical protein